MQVTSVINPRNDPDGECTSSSSLVFYAQSTSAVYISGRVNVLKTGQIKMNIV